MIFINSIDNKLIKSTKKLFSDKKYRDQSNLFVAETYKVVDTLIKQGFVPRNILITKSSHYFQKMSGHQSLVVIAERIYEAISELKNGDGRLWMIIDELCSLFENQEIGTVGRLSLSTATTVTPPNDYVAFRATFKCSDFKRNVG